MKIKKILLIYAIIWFVIIAAFWFGLRMEPMLFSIAAFYVALPLTAFLVSLYLGRQESRLKWLFIPFCGLMQFLAPFVTFSLANIFTFDKVVLPDIFSAFFSMVPALIGMILSIRHVKKKTKKAAEAESEEN